MRRRQRGGEGGGGASSAEKGDSSSSGSSGDDEALCGEPTLQWQQGLRKIGSAKDEQALAALVRASTGAVAGQADVAQARLDLGAA